MGNTASVVRSPISTRLILLSMALLLLALGWPQQAEAGSYFGFHLGYWGPRFHYYRPYFRPYYPPFFWGYAAVPVAPASYVRYSAGVAALGGLDLNVKPKKAAVFVDGEYVGVAGDFDGFPGYLWLNRGRHLVAFHRDGYETVAQDVHVVAGRVVSIKVRLARGVATPLEELAPPQREPTAAPTESREILDLAAASATVTLRVLPADASVYLDGRFLGTGEQLGRLHSGLLLDEGEHELDVVRPGLESRSLRFRVNADEDLELDINLESPA